MTGPFTVSLVAYEPGNGVPATSVLCSYVGPDSYNHQLRNTSYVLTTLSVSLVSIYHLPVSN